MPANRIGAKTFTPDQLKVIQEVITLSVFGVFSVFYFGDKLHWNHAAAFACLTAGAFFMFHKSQRDSARIASNLVTYSLLRCAMRWMVVAGVCLAAGAQVSQLELGRKAVHDRAGCFLVDYSFVETEALKPGYVKDSRVYDVNTNKSVKEWIYVEDLSPTRVWLQHVLQATKLDGEVMDGAMLKHTAEDWQFGAPFLYEYQGGNAWAVKDLKATPEMWTRRVVALDDGLRYQCAAAFTEKREYADWTCRGAAPIPGREYRDMKRKDYQDLDRTSEVIAYAPNWLERERNTKVISEAGVKTPLVKELGKTWYVRVPDTQCTEAQKYMEPQKAFWALARDVWDEVLDGKAAFVEAETAKGKASRYDEIEDIESVYVTKDLKDPAVRAKARGEILASIAAHRGK